MNNIKAAIFDLDGTLIDSMHVWHKIDRDFLGKRGLEVPPGYAHDIGTMSYNDIAEYTIKLFGLKETPRELMDEWDSMALDEYSSNIFLKPYTRDYLESLSKKKIKLAVVTSLTPALGEPVLKNNGIREMFELIVSTNEVGIGKSDPEIYLHTAKRLNVQPEECIIFDDLIAAIKAAKQAGMTVYGVYDKSSEAFKDEILRLADGYIHDFSQAPCI